MQKKQYAFGNMTSPGPNNTTVFCKSNAQVGNNAILSANMVTVGDQFVGIQFGQGESFGVTDTAKLPIEAKFTSHVFTEDLQPVGFLGTSDEAGKIYSLGFVTFSRSCEQDRLDEKEIATNLLANSTTTTKADTKLTEEELKKKSMIYIILIIIGTGVVLTAIVVVVIVLIRQLKKRTDSSDEEEPDYEENKKQ